MTKAELEQKVRSRFKKGLCGFIRQKAEVESLHDHEIADILDVSKSRICKLRRAYGIKRADGFSRRFERTYGVGAIETFKKMISSPENSLADVGAHFGFSREYARHVYGKIYGRPYTEAYEKKRLLKQNKRHAEKIRKSKRAGAIMKVGKKMKSMGLPYRVTSQGRSYVVFTNGYRLGFRVSSKPTIIGKKAYFRINNANRDKEKYDFLICLCSKEKEDVHYIIPSEVLPKALVSLLPEATRDQSKYAKFKEAWHLLAHDSPEVAHQSH